MAELLTNRLTSTRAGYLDAAISTRLSSAVKTVQYGTVSVVSGTTSGTTTITAVTIGKAVLIHLGSADSVHLQVSLTNSTTVSVFQAASTGSPSAGFCVVEFW